MKHDTEIKQIISDEQRQMLREGQVCKIIGDFILCNFIVTRYGEIRRPNSASWLKWPVPKSWKRKKRRKTGKQKIETPEPSSKINSDESTN